MADTPTVKNFSTVNDLKNTGDLDTVKHGSPNEAASILLSKALAPCILAIGTATPEHVVSMKSYARTFGENLGLSEANIQFTERICKSAQITTKYLAIPFERYIKEPSLLKFGAPSLDIRLGWYEEEAVNLAERASCSALKNWGDDRSLITHVIVYSTSGALSPGLDLRLIKILRLPRCTKHFWTSFNGCHAGVMGIRTAAEIAQSNSKNRVLMVWVEVNSCQAQPPDPKDVGNNIVVASIFGDGAAAVVVGAQPEEWESPIYEIVRCRSSYIDSSEETIVARLKQAGLHAGLAKSVPKLVGENVGGFAREMLEGTALTSAVVNWAVHPGGRAILDAVEANCCLLPDQLQLSRRILDQYSNMGAPTIIFVLQEFWKELAGNSNAMPWTLSLAFGPGISMEGALLRLAL